MKFDNDNKDEELYEHVFGKFLKPAEDDGAPTKTMPPPRQRARVNRTSDRGSNDSEPKRVTFSESSPTASDDSGDHAANVSEREKRSRLRHSKVEDAPPAVDGSKRRMHSNNDFPKNKRQKASEEVVVVKLLTGTLYLYRGAHRRAEFVRRV